MKTSGLLKKGEIREKCAIFQLFYLPSLPLSPFSLFLPSLPPPSLSSFSISPSLSLSLSLSLSSVVGLRKRGK